MKLLSLFAIALGNLSDDRKFTNDNDFMSQETPAWWLNKPAVERLSVLVSPLTVGSCENNQLEISPYFKFYKTYVAMHNGHIFRYSFY